MAGLSASGRRHEWAPLAFWFVLLLLPLGRSSELPLLAIALAGLALGWKERHALWRIPAVRLSLALFACWWLPALFSAPDAVEPAKTWSTVAGGLRFAPFLLGAVLLLGGDERALARLRWLAAMVVALWTADALLQAATGWSVAGRLDGDRLSGIFGDENQKLGPVLAVLSPVLLLESLDRYGRRVTLLLWLLLGTAILLAGARAGWVAYAVVTVLVAARVAHGARQFGALLGIAAAAGLALSALAYVASPRFAERIERTLVVTEGSAAATDHALAFRLPIWHAALGMAAAHPVNGVGARGFRYAYAEFAAADDRWLDPRYGQGALHAHQWLLEAAAETGLVGVAAWIAGIALALRAWIRASRERRHAAQAPALALVAMWFPLNTHFAFYSAWWSLLCFWLLAWYCAALREPRGATT
jgi:O-antigen ligase